jgi:hypothetical protein
MRDRMRLRATSNRIKVNTVKASTTNNGSEVQDVSLIVDMIDVSQFAERLLEKITIGGKKIKKKNSIS